VVEAKPCAPSFSEDEAKRRALEKNLARSSIGILLALSSPTTQRVHDTSPAGPTGQPPGARPQKNLHSRFPCALHSLSPLLSSERRRPSATARESDAAASASLAKKKKNPRRAFASASPPMSGPRPAPAATQNPSAPPPRPPPPPPTAAPAPARAREEGELSSGADDDEVSSPRPPARTLSPPAGLGSSCFALSFRSRPPGHRLWLGPRVCGELPRCSCLPLTLRIVPVAWISAVEYAWLDCLAALLVCNSRDCGRMGAFFFGSGAEI
jgi:hypothetical protein